jgi:Transposase DDE domain
MEAILERFVAKAPVAVALQATMRRAVSATALDALFDRVAQGQYTKELTFAALVELMTKVTFGTYRRVHTAYRHTEGIPVTVTAVYDKLSRLETAVSRALVEETAATLGQIIAALPLPPCPQPIAGLRLRVLDGNHLAGTDRRLDCLRGSGAAALPGLALVARDGRTGLLTHVIPCEDAYRSERALHPEFLPVVQADDLWVMDRNFCTLDFLGGIEDRGAYFLVRHHAQTKLKLLTKRRAASANASGRLYEQKVCVGPRTCRLIVVELHEPLRDGATEIRLLTNVPATQAGAKALADLYRTRWTIESAFQELTDNLRCELNTLGYPKAALFGFCLALMAYNVLKVVEAALTAGQGQQPEPVELSSYHLATEMAAFAEGLAIAIDADTWRGLVDTTPAEFAAWLHEIFRGIDYARYRKNKRGPKKPVTIKRTQRGAHRSTARELQGLTPP